MSEHDALKDYVPKGSGLYLKVEAGKPVKLRVLTLDPVVSLDKWGGTKYAFVVWNWTESKAQIWSTTPGVLKQLTAIHRDEDIDSLNKIDIKISAEGEMKEKRYTIIPLTKSEPLTRDIINEAQKIKLEDNIENGVRLSEYDEDEGINTEVETESDTPGLDSARAQAAKLKGEEAEDIKDTVDEVFPDDGEEINIDDIPF